MGCGKTDLLAVEHRRGQGFKAKGAPALHIGLDIFVDAKDLLDELLERYIELQVYQGVVENIACEQAAKMMAMKSATDNAGELIKQFQLAYNKARQAAITQELAEIVGGMAALEEGI